VIEQALERLTPGGKMIIADVLDLAQKEAFKQSLGTHNNESERSATQLNNGLYVDQQFFFELQSELTQIAEVLIQKRTEGFDNELRYRYDVVLKKSEADSAVPTGIQPTASQNHLWTAWHLQQQSDQNPSTFVSSDNTAYIIYTSGSTGVPKGVVVRHQPVINLINWVNRTFQVSSTDQILFVTSLCFDLSVYDIFGLLAAGGSIDIASETQQKSPEQLLYLLCSEPITFWDSAPAVLQQLVPFFDSAPATHLSHLRLVFLSGDWIPTTLPDALKEAFPGTEVIGLGGATEATIWSNYYPIDTVDPEWVSIPYGKPIQNAQYHILDSHLNPCPIGVPGDLYIGGDCLATGYANDPTKTAQRFIADPFSPEPEVRLYHTGDLARYLPDGNIEFLGRLDHQVKVRGFRIELGEIETALRRHPAVCHTVVMAREDTPGQKRLVAYLLTTQNVSVAHLRSYLREKLPEYMIPAVFVMLEAFPLTPNGKIDRKALPIPEISRSDLEATFVAPQTEVEQQIAAIWSELLGIHPLGIHDHFFELGGNSLLAARAIAKMQDTLKVEIPVRYLFEFPTIDRLAQRLENQQIVGTESAAINLKADVVLPTEIRPQGIIKPQQISQPNHIFLTGTTGFLGAFLLDELLRKTSATLYCLVRSADAPQGMNKLQQTLEKYHLWHPEFRHRIVPVAGDLEKPLLGLSVTQFNQLAAQIDVIYHSGAQVNFVKPYSVVKTANVLGTQEVLKLAVQTQVKPLHYISTAGVFGPVNYFEDCPILFENEDIGDYEEYVALDLGYSQSKWVAEQLIKIAQSRGLPVTIMRPGFMLGHPETGVTNTTDFWSRFIKGCLLMGYFPELVNQRQEFIPINYVSEAIVHLSMQSDSIGKVFHLTPPKQNLTTIELFELIQGLGYPLQSLPYSQWKQILLQQTKQSPNHALVPLLPIFTEKVYNDLTIMELYQNNPEYDCQNTIAGLQGTSIQCPEINQALVKTYLSYFMEIGFIESSVTAKVG
jgi:thioester reductase-like protein/amino acid adenylation domain-containing protein